MTRRASLLLAAFLLAAPAPAAAGTVTGRVSFPAPPERSAAVDLYGKYNQDPDAPAPPRGGVVALVPRGETALPHPGEAPVMDQKDLRFQPHVLPVAVGTRVRFTNSDKYFHNVFSLSPAKKFDLGRYPKGGSEDVVFDRPGVISLFCDIHAEMQAYVVVLPTSYFAVTGGDGSFRIDDVPPGEYDVLLWHETAGDPRPAGTAVVTGAPFALDLAFPAGS